MLKLEQISKFYRTDEFTTYALQSVSLNIESGEFVAIMGPSGCGKSTLLNILGLIDLPSAGQYHFFEQDVTHLRENAAVEIRRKHIGFVFQNFNLVDQLSVSENIELALLYQNISTKERKLRVEEAMDSVAIGHRAKHFPNQLSGGQQQRVALARAIVSKPSIILADEPTGNLDSAHGQDVMEMLQGLNESGTTIVMVTHSAIHADYARRAVHLFDGQVLTQNLKAIS